MVCHQMIHCYHLLIHDGVLGFRWYLDSDEEATGSRKEDVRWERTFPINLGDLYASPTSVSQRILTAKSSVHWVRNDQIPTDEPNFFGSQLNRVGGVGRVTGIGPVTKVKETTDVVIKTRRKGGWTRNVMRTVTNAHQVSTT